MGSEPSPGSAHDAGSAGAAGPNPSGTAGGGALALGLLTGFAALLFPGAAMPILLIGGILSMVVGGIAASPDGAQSEASRSLGAAGVVLGVGCLILGLLVPVLRST